MQNILYDKGSETDCKYLYSSEYIFCAFPIKNEIWYSTMGKIEGKHENIEHTKKGDKNDDWSEKGGIM